jgi:hypothetical protein
MSAAYRHHYLRRVRFQSIRQPRDHLHLRAWHSCYCSSSRLDSCRAVADIIGCIPVDNHLDRIHVADSLDLVELRQTRGSGRVRSEAPTEIGR